MVPVVSWPDIFSSSIHHHIPLVPCMRISQLYHYVNSRKPPLCQGSRRHVSHLTLPWDHLGPHAEAKCLLWPHHQMAQDHHTQRRSIARLQLQRLSFVQPIASLSQEDREDYDCCHQRRPDPANPRGSQPDCICRGWYSRLGKRQLYNLLRNLNTQWCDAPRGRPRTDQAHLDAATGHPVNHAGNWWRYCQGGGTGQYHRLLCPNRYNGAQC